MGSKFNKAVPKSDEVNAILGSLGRRDFVKLGLGLLGPAAFRSGRTLTAGEGAIDAVALQVAPYGIGPCWPTGYGDVRARVRVHDKVDAVWAHIPWRRRDSAPETKGILLVDAHTGAQLKNVAIVQVNREFGDIIFQPPTVPGEYCVYYMPYNIHPVQWEYSVQYDSARATADPAWLERNELLADRLPGGKWKLLPTAETLEIQARSEFDRFDPMEVIATSEERQKLLAGHPSQDLLLFPEDREFPIRMTDDLPLHWIVNGPSNRFRGEARRGEF